MNSRMASTGICCRGYLPDGKVVQQDEVPNSTKTNIIMSHSQSSVIKIKQFICRWPMVIMTLLVNLHRITDQESLFLYHQLPEAWSWEICHQQCIQHSLSELVNIFSIAVITKLTKHVPNISLTVPDKCRAILRSRITRAISNISSSVRLPLCLTESTGQYN